MQSLRVPTKLTALHVVAMLLSVISAITIPLYTTNIHYLPFVKTTFDLNNTIILESVGSIPIYTFPIVCFVVNTLHHAFCLLFPSLYLRLAAGIAWFRWIPYAISLPLTFATVAYSIGITDQAAIAALCVCIFQIVCTGILHDIARLQNQPRMDSTIIGFLSLLLSFVPIYNAHLTYTNVPQYAAAILAFCTISMSAIVAVPVISDYHKEKFPYINSEYLYIIFSSALFLLVGHLFTLGHL